jgi:hypothetical protein
VVWLVEEDGSRLNAQVEEETNKNDEDVGGCTPLMLAAWKGHDKVVARLLALGADMGLQSEHGDLAVHLACKLDQPSTLSLLLDAGASLNARSAAGRTPLIYAVYEGATECVKLLLARGGGALKLNARDSEWYTALHWATLNRHHAVVHMLLQAGADPTIPDDGGETPLCLARREEYQRCIALLDPAVCDAQRARTLFKARALLDAAHAIPSAFKNAREKNLPMLAQQQAVLAAAPAYLKGRVAWAQELPRVQVVEDKEGQQDEEELVACLKYALGLEGGGGWHEGEGPAPRQGMLREVFVELCELLVPKWDLSRKGLPLGEERAEDEDADADDSQMDEEGEEA